MGLAWLTEKVVSTWEPIFSNQYSEKLKVQENKIWRKNKGILMGLSHLSFSAWLGSETHTHTSFSAV